jgi:hypothetical protein
MITITGYSIAELMEKTGKKRNTIEALLAIHKVKPVLSGYLYPPEALELIANAKRGRPAKKPKPDA